MLKIIDNDSSNLGPHHDVPMDQCKDFETIVSRANTYLESGNLDAAYPYLKSAVEINPDYAEGYNHLGIFFSRNKNYMEALNNFKKALQCDFTLVEAHYNIASLYMERKEYDMALPHFKEVVMANPEDYETYHLMGFCCSHCNMETEAESFLTESHRLNRDYIPSAIELSKILIKKGNNAKAKNILLCLLMNNQSIPEIHFLLGVIYKTQKKYVKAMRHLREAVLKDQNNAVAYNLLGECCLESDMERESESLFTMATRLDATYASAFYNLGNLYYKQKKYTDAIFSLEEYIRYKEATDNINALWSNSSQTNTEEEEMVSFYNLLGHCYKTMKNPIMARTAWEKSLSIQPQQQAIKNALKEISQPTPTGLQKRISLIID